MMLRTTLESFGIWWVSSSRMHNLDQIDISFMISQVLVKEEGDGTKAASSIVSAKGFQIWFG